MSGQIQDSAILFPEKNTVLIVGSRVCLEVMTKRNIPAPVGKRTLVVQPATNYLTISVIIQTIYQPNM